MPPMMPAGVAPWRMLLLDRSPDDPKWILATVVIPGDVRPAALNTEGGYTGWDEITAWVRGQLGSVGLMPFDALAWTIEPHPRWRPRLV